MNANAENAPDRVRLFLAGDVMPGRGIDQILPGPCDPAIHEDYMRSAAGYVDLAERRAGPIPRPVGADYIWGALLEDLDNRGCDLRVVNLETAITRRGEPEPKGINYRMSPENAAVLTAARIDACILANNHVLDWGEVGLLDTLATLARLGVGQAGAGPTAQAAAAPCICALPGHGRVLVLAFGHGSAGVPAHWQAGADRPGVAVLPDRPEEAAALVRGRIAPVRRPADIVLLSLHWGGNWGYDIPQWQRRMAHVMVDEAGVDLVFGHSSHHPKGMEVHRGKLILYGCGDLINDYEGIGGHEAFRPDLGLAFIVGLETETGRFAGLEILPYVRYAFALVRADEGARRWLAEMLARESRLAGWWLAPSGTGSLCLRPNGAG